MDENTKELLYTQIEEMYENNSKNEPIISKQEYMELSATEALKYIFKYRDSADFGIDEDDGGRNTYYIELPDMDLSGEDLTELKISEFIPATIDEDGKLMPSNLNFENTNALIDVNDIGYTRSEENDRGITDYVIDFETMNFKGCFIYGILPDEYSDYETDLKAKIKSHYITANKEGHLDERYLERRKEEHLSKEEKIRADRAYQRIINGESLYRMRGIGSGINFEDYDFSRLNQKSLRALGSSIIEYNIKLNYSMLMHQEYWKEFMNSFSEPVIDSYTAGKIVNQEYEKGNMEFVNAHMSDIDSYTAGKIVNQEYEKGNMEFVNANMSDIDSYTAGKIVNQEYEKGNMEFVNANMSDIDSYTAGKIVNQEYEKGNIEFVNTYSKYLDSYNAALIIKQKYEKGNIEFVNANIGFLKGSDDYDARHIVQEIFKKECEKENMEFIKAHWDVLTNMDWTRSSAAIIVSKAFEYGDKELLEEHLDEFYKTDKYQIIRNTISTGKADLDIIIPYIKKYIEYEKTQKETIGKKEQSCSGKLLYEVLNNNNVSTDLMLEIIKAGSNLNYTGYQSEKKENYITIITYKPLLMKALEIQDEERKEQIIRALIETGVNTSAETKQLTYSRFGLENVVTYSPQQDEIFSKIVEEQKIKRENEERKKAIENENNVKDFFKNEIRLSEDEISKLEATFQDFGNSVYNCSYDTLKLQKEILSSVNCERQGFTKNARILFLDPKVIYSRLKFFMDNDIEINPNDLQKTLACTNRKFIMNYGSKILGVDNVDESRNYEVRCKLLEKYPMPTKKKELMEELKKIKEKNNQKEMD